MKDTLSSLFTALGCFGCIIMLPAIACLIPIFVLGLVLWEFVQLLTLGPIALVSWLEQQTKDSKQDASDPIDKSPTETSRE